MKTNTLIELFKPDYDIFFGAQEVKGKRDSAPYGSFDLNTGKSEEYNTLIELYVAIISCAFDSKEILFSPGLGTIESLKTTYAPLSYEDRHHLIEEHKSASSSLPDFNEDIPNTFKMLDDYRLN